MKKSFYAVCVLLFVAILMVGCAAPQPAAEPTQAPAAEGEAPAAEGEAPAAEAPAQSDVTLSLMASQGWIVEAELELAKKFEEETGIHVDYQIIPADQYFNVLRTKLNSGEGTDIFSGQSGQTDLKVQYDVQTNAVDLTNEEWVSRMDPNSREMVSLEGKVYGLEIWDTIASNYFVVNYNKEIFAELGIEVPTNFAEFMAACETIKEAGKVPVYQPISDGWHHVLWFPMVGPRFEEVDPGLAERLNNNETTFAESEIMQEAMTQLNELYQAGCFGDNALSDAFADTGKALASGDYVMAVSTLTQPTSIETDYDVPADTFGFFPMPLADNTLAPAHPAGPSKFIYSKSPHVEEARQYFEFLTRPENLQFLLDNSTEFATLNFEGVESKWNAEQEAFLEQYPAKTIVYQDIVNYLNPQWMDMGKDMVAMFTGSMTPVQVLESIDQRRAEMAQTAKDPAWVK